MSCHCLHLDKWCPLTSGHAPEWFLDPSFRVGGWTLPKPAAKKRYLDSSLKSVGKYFRLITSWPLWRRWLSLTTWCVITVFPCSPRFFFSYETDKTECFFSVMICPEVTSAVGAQRWGGWGHKSSLRSTWVQSEPDWSKKTNLFTITVLLTSAAGTLTQRVSNISYLSPAW